MQCVYCKKNQASTRDHIIPEFLGGKRKVPACAECNNRRFGSGFEGEVSKNVAPLLVALELCGLKPARKGIVWKRAFSKDGDDFDLFVDKGKPTISLSDTKVETDENGGKWISFRSSKEAKKFNQSRAKKGRIDKGLRSRPVKYEISLTDLKAISFDVKSALRRLAVKMCVGLAESGDIVQGYMDETCNAFLLDEESIHRPVRVAYLTYPSLDEIRPSLAHVVYIEGNPETGLSYGVVQLFGSIQLYVVLNKHFEGSEFARIAVLDNISKTETINNCRPLMLSEAPELISAEIDRYGPLVWMTRLDMQVNNCFGSNFFFFGPDGPIREVLETKDLAAPLRKFYPEGKYPILWISHFPDVKFEMDFRPLDIVEEDITLRVDFINQCRFFTERGIREHPLLEFIAKWNAKKIDLTLGKDLTFTPDTADVYMVLDEKYRFAIRKLQINYIVQQSAWSGWYSGEVPQNRDLAWQTVSDIEKFRQSISNYVTVEEWGISQEIQFAKLEIVLSNE